MIMVYVLNYVDLPMPKKQPYSLMYNFILCPTDKHMFKVNKLVFGNCGSSIYCQNDQFRKSYILFDTYVLFNKQSLLSPSFLLSPVLWTYYEHMFQF